MGAHRESQPLISVVIPCFNAEAFIEAALRSVLEQDYPSIDIVAVDDCSTDSTGDILRRLGEHVRAVTLPSNRGPAAARNAGLAAAKGPLVVLLDADDALEPGALTALADGAREHPDARFVIPHVQIVDPNGTMIQDLPPVYRLDLHEVLALQIPQTCGILIRKPLGLPAVRYDQPSYIADRLYAGREDWVFWIDVAALGVQVAHAPKAHTHYVQRNPRSLSSDTHARWQGGLGVLEHGKRVAASVHGDCDGCRSALSEGRRALADYCLKGDATVIFGLGVPMTRRAKAFARVVRRRDRTSTLMVMRTSAWQTRDALKHRIWRGRRP